MAIQTEWVRFPVAGSDAGEGYLARPAGDVPAPGVVVVHEIFGVNDHIQSIVERLAQAGFTALAPDYFRRQARGVSLGYGAEDVQQGRRLKARLQVGEIEADTRAAAAYLQSLAGPQGFPMVSVGFCAGGVMSLLGAAAAGLTGAVSFYGAGLTGPFGGEDTPPLHKLAGFPGWMLLFYGGKDPLIPASEREEVTRWLEEKKRRATVEVFPTSDHGFFGDARSSFDPEAAAAAWGKLIAFLDACTGAVRSAPEAPAEAPTRIQIGYKIEET